MANRYFEGIGRRKRSTARVRVMSGTGNFIVNDKQVEEYFPRLGDLEEIPMMFLSRSKAAASLVRLVQSN